MKHCTDALAFLSEQLAELERQNLRRRPAAPVAPDAVSFCSNDYLGLAALPAPGAPSGAGASRLIAGERDEHRRCERAFASWLGTEDVLLFTSGYAANVGTVAALAGPGDLLVSDALNHASLIDGARLSRAQVAIVPHGDLRAIRRVLAVPRTGRAWVIAESYYSMDADGPDLAELRRVCDDAGAALVLDEAHALGVMGPGGRGRAAESGIHADVLIGTLGKAFGAQGAFVAGSAVLREWLWNRARSFVFSTGLAPASAAAAERALALVIEKPDLGARVLRLAERLRTGLLRTGALGSVPGSAPHVLGFGHIVPIVVGAPERALRLAGIVQEAGFAAHAVRPPTVPTGTSRLRLTVTARHTDAQIDGVIAAVAAGLAKL